MIRDFSHKDRWILYLVFSLLIFAVFLNLGIYPLYLEEPRRALIALEMLFNNNLWVPTEFGEYYYKKPPVYNWVIIAGYKIFGNYSEFTVRFFSIISYLSMGLITFLAGRKYVSSAFGVYSALLFFVCSDLLFYFTITSGEIDLFYALITYLGFISTYYYYKRGNYWLLFAVTYLLAAIGTLTKGLPSMVFQGIMILTVFIFHKNYKGLFKLSHLIGILLYLSIVGGYIYIYSQYNDPLHFISSKESVLTQSMERTPFENGFLKVFQHLLLFPLELLKILAPGSLLLLLFLSKRSRKAIKENQYVMFCLVLFVTNIWVYWVSPGTASRYLYMMFPLIISALLYPLFEQPSEKLIRMLNLIFISVIVIFGLTSLALPFIPRLDKIPFLWGIAIAFGIIFGVLAVFHFQYKTWRLMILISAFICMRILFDLIILPIRATEDKPYDEKVIAEDIYEITGDKPIAIFGASEFSRGTIFYLERANEKVLTIDTVTTANQFYIADLELIPENKNHKTFYDFEHKGHQLQLIRFVNE